MKKLAICAVALCATAPLFAGEWVDLDTHAPSRQAQKQLADDMLSYLNKGKAKDIEKLFNAIPECKKLKKSYKENRKPTVCRVPLEQYYPHTIDLEAASKPGFFKRDVLIATVCPDRAFRSAATRYFTLKKDSAYLDYNEMQKFYANYRYTWAGRQLKEWTTHGYTSYAMTAFVTKTILPNIVPEENNIWPDRFLETVARHMHDWSKMRMPQWREEATKVYNDKATFYQVKWNLFKAIMLYDFDNGPDPDPKQSWLMSTKFWENFAIAPVYKDESVREQQAKAIRDAVKDAYENCEDWNKHYRKQRKVSRRYDCEKIRTNARDYGYWDDPAKVATQKTKQKLNQTKKK